MPTSIAVAHSKYNGPCCDEIAIHALQPPKGVATFRCALSLFSPPTSHHAPPPARMATTHTPESMLRLLCTVFKVETATCALLTGQCIYIEGACGSLCPCICPDRWVRGPQLAHGCTPLCGCFVALLHALLLGCLDCVPGVLAYMASALPHLFSIVGVISLQKPCIQNPHTLHPLKPMVCTSHPCMQGALLTMHPRIHQRAASSQTSPLCPTPRRHASCVQGFCGWSFLNAVHEMLVIEDTDTDARFAANYFVTDPGFSIKFYVAAPLITANGHRLVRRRAFMLVRARLVAPCAIVECVLLRVHA